MDYRLNTLLRHYVLVNLLLEIHWRPVSASPVPPSNSCSNLQATLNLSVQLELEAKDLLNQYIQYHGEITGPIPEEVPPSTISGDTIPEKLQDTYTRNLLFKLHLEKVKEYQVEFFGNPQSIVEPLTQLKERLHHLSSRVKLNLSQLYPETPTPSPAPPQSHSDDYARKVYGWGIIESLRNWLKQVQQVVMETQKANGCD